eukprot:15387160-Heterocapsa_arctica.AAC.1
MPVKCACRGLAFSAAQADGATVRESEPWPGKRANVRSRVCKRLPRTLRRLWCVMLCRVMFLLCYGYGMLWYVMLCYVTVCYNTATAGSMATLQGIFRGPQRGPLLRKCRGAPTGTNVVLEDAP